MKTWMGAGAAGLVSLAALAANAASNHGEAHHDEDGHHAHHEPYAFTYDVRTLDIEPNASFETKLELLQADFDARVHRLDWKSDSVVKRVRWALADARALSSSDSAAAEERLEDARSLLERW